MNKKGFSLVEILAVIVILAVISIIGVSVYNGIRDQAVSTTLENVVLKLENAATEYARDTSNLTVSVEDLVNLGYVQADSETVYVANPTDNTDLKCQIINTTFDQGEYTSVLNIVSDDELLDENGDCVDYIVETTKELEVFCINDDGSYLDSSACSIVVNSKTWYTGSIKLELSSDYDLSSISSYAWSSKNGHASSGNVDLAEDDDFKISVDIIDEDKETVNTTYTLNLIYSNNSVETINKEVLIDNESPQFLKATTDQSWSNGSKTIEISATDSGSGVNEYCVILSSDASVDNCLWQESSSFELSNGEYTVYIKDYVGNVSSADNFEISNIDQSAPSLTDASYDTKEEVYNTVSSTKYYSSLTRTITFTDLDSGISSIDYCITTNSTCTPTISAKITKGYTASADIEFTSSNATSQRICTIATDTAGNKSDIYCDSAFFIDNTAPSVTISNSDNSNKILITASDSESGINTYTCKYGTSSSSLSNSGTIVTENGNTYCQISTSPNTKYYVQVSVTNKALLSTSSSVINFTAEVTLDQVYENSCGDNEYCSNVIFVNYNGSIFGIYRNVTEGYKALYQGSLTRMNYGTSFTSCCDSGSCKESTANYALSTVATYVNSFVYSTTYSDRATKLVEYTGFCTAPIDIGVCSTTYTSYAGLLDYNEFSNISYLSTLFSHDGLNSSSYYVFLANRSTSSYSGVTSYVYYNGSAYYKTEEYGEDTTHAYVKPVFVFKKDVTIISGSGTYANPYVI